MGMLFIVPLIFGLYCLFVGFIQWVWNEAVVTAFTNLPVLTFWQTFGSMVIVGFVGSCFRRVDSKK